MTVEYIMAGGAGGEARVDIEDRDEFPGVGGEIRTYQSILTAHRRLFNYSPQAAATEFFRHSVVKKLDDFFFRTDQYNIAHIARPFGITDDGYLYEWVDGSDGFSWQTVEENKDGGYSICGVVLEDWINFANLYINAGVDMTRDITESDDATWSKNIVRSLSFGTLPRILNTAWKRIDFGRASMPIDYEKLHDYLMNNQRDLSKYLTVQRYQFMVYATEYLMAKGDISPRDRGKLKVQTLNFRRSTLRHINKRGFDREAGVKDTLTQIAITGNL
ncbi:hypothetical protein ACFL1B_05055 [Nanoarchaeota archaeon]